MTTDERWKYILKLADELLKRGVILSEWTTFPAKDAEATYCLGANLSSILACQAAIEKHLRYEYCDPKECNSWGFSHLIAISSLDDEIKADLHELRRFGNKWIHVKNPPHDEYSLKRPTFYETESEDFAKISIKTMLRAIYYD